MNTTVRAIYNRRNRLDKNGQAPINIEVYAGGVAGFRKFINTGIAVEPHYWNEAKGCIDSKHPSAHHYNKIIRDIVAEIQDFAYSQKANGKPFSLTVFTDYINAQHKGRLNFIQFFEQEIDPALKWGTRKEHEYTYNILKEYNPNLTFDDIDLTFVQGFDTFMRTKKKLMQNTIHKHHQHINRFLRLAAAKNLYDANRNPYANFKSKKEQSDRISLSPDELNAITGISTTAYPELMLIKDMFLFSCYTGLRFSDITTLERKHIIDSSEGLCIVKKMEKVPKPVTLPLTLLFDGKPNQIIQPYLNNMVAGLIFPPITNQHANRLLKVIATLTKTPMRLTFHIARHTFGTMLANTTQNPYLIMDLMGHADIKTSMIYIHRSQERINKQLRGVKWY